ncbi:MAG: adenylate kinase [Opitutales bacterium]|nr:adenylate kinase [Opitutales bacterium]
MLNLALFGPPGAGKGTQSQKLIDQFNLSYISTGDLLRKELAAKTSLGQQAKDIIASGGLVSDEIIVQLIEKTISGNPGTKGFLFDGFPRTLIQAYILEGLMIKLHTSLTALVNLEVPNEVSIERLVNRGKTSGRSDDHDTVIRQRLREYEEKTLPVLEFYSDKGICHNLDATQAIEEVNQQILGIIHQELSKQLFNVVLFGYPGSGRGSQGRALAKAFGLEYVATGEMLEEEIRSGSNFGQKIQKLYDNGELVPDEIVIPLIEKRLARREGVKGFIFKGFPRTLVQAYILEGLLKKHGASIDLVLDLEVPTLELIKRLDQRSKTDRCMPYDTSTEKIVRRLQEHEQKTIPVIDKYQQLHRITRVNGEGSFDEVFAKLSEKISQGIEGVTPPA